MTFPFFGTEPARSSTGRRGQDRPDDAGREAGLRAHLALARELAEAPRTPEDYVQASSTTSATSVHVLRAPPPEARTLDGFLFDAKSGYCQQFSGAMALLLRMAGIPARVVTGFSTGATDTKTGEYVVRDFDAHSWVEVYYPGWGWITFDPTPAASPARSQPADARSVRSGSDRRGRSSVGDPLAERGAGVPVARPSGAVVADWPIARPGVLALLGLRRARRRAAGARGAPPALVRARARAAPHAPRAGTRARRCTRSRRASRRRRPPPATCARCARAATATPRATRPAPSAAGCGPSSDAAPACSVNCVPGGPSRPGASRAYNRVDGRCL